jgi:hypothetical protein
MAITGVTRAFSPALAESETKAEFGAVSNELVVVVQLFALPVTVALVQPTGNAGAVTPSNF